jgi:hypothetical protein
VLNFPGYKRDANQNYTKISSHLLEWPYSKAKRTNAGEDVGKQEHLYTVGRTAN